jgi:hypothetical protein
LILRSAGKWGKTLDDRPIVQGSIVPFAPYLYAVNEQGTVLKYSRQLGAVEGLRGT